MSAVTDYFRRAALTNQRAVVTTLASAKTAGTTTAQLQVATGWVTQDISAVDVTIYRKKTDGTIDAATQTDWVGLLTGSSLSGMVLKAGTEPVAGYPNDALTVVKCSPTAAWANSLIEGIGQFANKDGTLIPAAVRTALGITSAPAGDWNLLNAGVGPSAVVANGNHSYNLTFATNDLTSVISKGARLKLTRTVAAPTQSTSLNGTSQYYSKTSPAGMTFTDDFTVSAWVKLASYASGVIASRYNGTSGWILQTLATGQIQLTGYNGGIANNSYVQSYQSIPLNKWVHVTAQLDMSAFTATTTTSYIMLDGVDVPVSVSRGGTNPTALIQAGNLEIGSTNAGSFFPGKIAQVAIYSAKVTQATILASMNQTLAGTETSLISAYSFNNNLNDLNTTNANNLTANGSAVATNTDSPFGGQASGTPSATLEYGIIQNITYSVNTTVTVQVPEGSAIPTSGGVASVSYSNVKTPYGMPVDTAKWKLSSLYITEVVSGAVASGTVYNPNKTKLTLPIGAFEVFYNGSVFFDGIGAITSFIGYNDTALPLATPELVSMSFNNSGTIITKHTARDFIATTAQTPIYCNFISNTTATGVRWYTPVSVSQPAVLIISACPTYL